MAVKRIVIIADTYSPLRTSGAVQLRDLSKELLRQGHSITVIVPAPDLNIPWKSEILDQINVLRLKIPHIKETNYIRRTVSELIMPFSMLWQLKKTPFINHKWDAIIWYSPSIFHGPLVKALKKRSGCRSYLIIRDIFPEWALEMGLLSRGIPYLFFDAIARYQYSVADVIGIQSPGNMKYFHDWLNNTGRHIEVLQNWLGRSCKRKSSIEISETSLAGRKIFIYAGNMGVAQGLSVFLDLAQKFQIRKDVGFLFVGRGSEFERLKTLSEKLKLDNILFFEEINVDEIPNLYAQCKIGIVSLDYRHKSHNIPGKFITYMQCGLPVLANINFGNDLAKVIIEEGVGLVCESNQLDELVEMADRILVQIDLDSDFSSRCINLFNRVYSVEIAARQIVKALIN